MMRTYAHGNKGFTLVELMMVVMIVGILATLAIPSYQRSVIKAREGALRYDLATLRDVLDQYRADKGSYPPALGDLVQVGYLKRIPVDPFTHSDQTWQVLADEGDGSGIADIHSGSPLVGPEGTAYNTW
jgi:general secretion pathway protein G